MSNDTITPRSELRLALVLGSVRHERIGASVAHWAQAQLTPLVAQLDLIDLAELQMPSEADLMPGGGPVQSPVADRVGAADAFVFITPEYNHSVPAGLKAFIDWHYSQWQFKAGTVVSYGAAGGWLAATHLRTVMTELSMATPRRLVALPQPWNHLGDNGFDPGADTSAALRSAASELLWWAGVLHRARTQEPFAA